ncbi:Uncharacterized protein YuzE [Micromonospora auratinigra]|uniref:Uncharacterized protein YuzE n=2 Tax=Micromonospora auratinigra TaxID=261654 RepID=A0A1A8Z595_9ACTN|nr:Uncharacterized protein YuzE [Micromonospora auratinigra]
MYTETRVPLVCSYDSDADAAYLYLDHPLPAAAVRRVVPFDPADGMSNLDLDADGRVVGLEILGAGRRLPPALLRAIRHPAEEQAGSD